MTSDWTSESFRTAMMALVRRHLPERDSEDLVQTVLVEALTSKNRPKEPKAVRRWIWGIVRHKIADYHRDSRWETLGAPEVTARAQVSDEAIDDLLRWALGELPEGADAGKTLAWLLLEADGETLDQIALDEKLPATQVRQRVSRLRRHFRERWMVYAGLGLATVLLYILVREGRSPEPQPHIEPSPEIQMALTRGRALRQEALHDCERHAWRQCLDGLDAARRLDPGGDAQPAIQNIRREALDGLRAPPPSDVPTVMDDAGVPRATVPVGPMDGDGGLSPRERVRRMVQDRGIFRTLGTPSSGTWGPSTGGASSF